MKLPFCLFFMIIVSCNAQKKNEVKTNTAADETSSIVQGPKLPGNNEISWTGNINGKLPVFIHYHLEGNLIVGEITYLNTRNKIPIKLLGTIEDDNTYRILEFDQTGNVTGIIWGLPTDQNFNGIWFSPKTRKELDLNLVKIDTTVDPITTTITLQDVFGKYHYQYSEEGYQGDFAISMLPGSKAAFDIIAVTDEPARNLAEIERDTIELAGTHFTYLLPEADNCEFEVTFYKGFALIKYTKRNCDGQFGMNATIEGIFLKIE